MYSGVKEQDPSLKGGHVLRLIRETVDGLGQLLVQHLKLAQLELRADLRSMVPRLALMAICAVLMIGGYMLFAVGVAFLIAGNRALALPLLGVGLFHVVGTGLGMRFLLGRLRGTSLMKATTGEISQSATALMVAASPPKDGQGKLAEPARLEPSRVR